MSSGFPEARTLFRLHVDRRRPAAGQAHAGGDQPSPLTMTSGPMPATSPIVRATSGRACGSFIEMAVFPAFSGLSFQTVLYPIGLELTHV